MLGKQTEVVHDRPREEADEEAANEEFHTFQLDAHSPALPKACHDWLELMVLHFDATQRLADYIKRTNKGSEVVIRIVSQTPPDRYMLPWKVLLNNKAYFPDNDPSFRVEEIISFLTTVANPTTTAESLLTPVAPSTTIAENLLTPIATSTTIDESFLDSHLDSTGNPTTSTADDTPQKIISAETLVQQLKEIGDIPKVINTDGRQEWNLDAFNNIIQPIIETVKNLKLTNCISVGWEEYANSIALRLVAFQNMWTLSDKVTTMQDISKIIKMIDTMRDNAMIYWA